MSPPKTKFALLTPDAAPVATVSVKALLVVNYDGTLYGPCQDAGDQFDCREPDVAQLLGVQAIELLPAPDDQAEAAQ